MNETDFINLFKPENLFSDEWLNVSFQFQNGHLYEYRKNVLMRKKGFIGSRIFPKKAFKVKFNTVKKLKWKGLKAINFKV